MSTFPDGRPVLLVAGTRPEVIKLAPVFLCLRERLDPGRVQWVSTGQHQTLEDEALHWFAIEPTHHFRARQTDMSLIAFSQRVVGAMTELQRQLKPALIIVQGDTVSAFAAALAAFHGRMPIAHVEAGLRSWDISSPFPEEAYRRMIDTLATIHLAPTPLAARNLEAEGCRPETVFVTGNTGVDALSLVDNLVPVNPLVKALALPPRCRLVFVTLHRRESWGRDLEGMCLALKDLVSSFGDIQIVLPVHVNPEVSGTIEPILKDTPGITLTPPLDYVDCHALIRMSHLILTDSGGIQEEAPSYGVPVMVLRKVTERPEAVNEGFAILVGTERKDIVETASRMLRDADLYSNMCAGRNPFGDGRAAQRITLAIERFLARQHPLLTKNEQYA